MKKAILVVLLIFPNLSFSADFSQCSILELITGANDKNSHIRLDCQVSPRPACAAASVYVAFDTTTERGEKFLANSMLAFANNYKVSGSVDQSACPAFQTNVAELVYLSVTK